MEASVPSGSSRALHQLGASSLGQPYGEQDEHQVERVNSPLV